MVRLIVVICVAVLAGVQGCSDDSNPSSGTQEVTGTWSVSETLGPTVTSFEFKINDDNTYEFSYSFDGDLREKETGTWSVSSDKITFSPEVCSEAEFLSSAVEVVECGEAVVVDIDIDNNEWVLPAGSAGQWPYTRQ